MASLSTPDRSAPLAGALGWITDTLLGSAATGVAILAVGIIGLMMLSGRLDWRRGATTIIGCFIIFGAATIAAGLHAPPPEEQPAVQQQIAPAPAAPNYSMVPPASPPGGYDPYAGAAPQR